MTYFPKEHSYDSPLSNGTTVNLQQRMPGTNTRWITPSIVQRKLAIGSVDDPLEQEADDMADHVMRMPEPAVVQRKCTQCEEEENVQRKSSPSFLQAKESSTSVVSGEATDRIQHSRGQGNTMDTGTKSFMERRFQADFSEVRIHADQEAVQLSRELQAQAFTIGNDIYFNEGKYNPHTKDGQHLLAHELTHTVQQGGVHRKIQRQEAPTGTFTMRLNEHGRVEFIAGTPELPGVGSLGAGFRCENGRCQPVFGQNPFGDATRDSYTVEEALGLLRSIGRGSSSGPSSGLGPGGLGPRPPFGAGGIDFMNLPCPPRQRRGRLGICELDFSQVPPSPSITSPGPFLSPPLFARPSLGLGQLHTSILDHFAHDSSTLPSNADAILQPLVQTINLLPSSAVVHIDGHTSTEGTNSRNMTLATDRANAVQARLLALGVVDASRLHVVPKGAAEPLVTPERNEDDRAQNRRVEVWFFDLSGPTHLRMTLPPFPSPTP